MIKEAYIPCFSDSPDWNSVPRLLITEPLSNKPCTAEAWAQICCTEDALLLRMAARNQEVRSEEHGPLGMPCFDSCLEFFFSPMQDDLRYINFEFNPDGCMYLGFGSGPEDHLRIILKEERQKALFAPVTSRTENGWDLSFRVPYTFIRQFFPDFCPKSGSQIRGNFYNCGDLLKTPHYITWSPITRSGIMQFHTPAEFGILHFA